MTLLVSLCTHSQKRQREEDIDEASALSKHNSHKFNDVATARDNPYHQIRIPQPKRKKEREDTVL
jgi:hypothetical protein